MRTQAFNSGECRISMCFQIREVPEGALAPLRLVHDQRGLAAGLESGHERVVRRGRQQAEQLQLAPLEVGRLDQRISARP